LETVDHKPGLFRRKSTWRFALRAAIGLTILVVLASFLDFSEILSTLKSADLVYVGLALALAVPNLYVQMLKWRVLLRTINPDVNARIVSSSFFFGLAIGTLTPGQIGEFGGRALRIETQRPGLVVGLTVLDKIQFMAVIVIAGLWSLAFLWDSDQLLLVGLAVLVTALLVGIVSFPKIITALLNRVGIQRLRRQVISDILESFAVVGAKTLTASLLLTVVLYAIILGQFFLLLSSFSPVGILDSSMGFAAALMAKSALPISIGDLGVREAATVFFLSMRDVPEAASFNASFLLSVINIFLPAIVGAFFTPKNISLKNWGTRTEEGGPQDQ
jgi:uncharacterized protein (TIRG00374 family)